MMPGVGGWCSLIVWCGMGANHMIQSTDFPTCDMSLSFIDGIGGFGDSVQPHGQLIINHAYVMESQ